MHSAILGGDKEEKTNMTLNQRGRACGKSACGSAGLIRKAGEVRV